MENDKPSSQYQRDKEPRKREEENDVAGSSSSKRKRPRQRSNSRSISSSSEPSDDDRKHKRKRSHSSKKKHSKKKSSRHRRRSRSLSSSRSRSSSSSSSDDDSNEERRRKHKKHKKKSKSKKDKKRKRERSSKKEKKSSSSRGATTLPVFGKYGIIKLSDMKTKERTFAIWLEEVKGIPSFSGPKWELQNYFKDYMEDYNTATLPHIKYYDYDKWEKEEYEKNKQKQNSTEGSGIHQDEAKHRSDILARAEMKRKEDFNMVKSMMSSDKIEEMKRKKQMQSEMAHAYKVGDLATYKRLKAKLEPEP